MNLGWCGAWSSWRPNTVGMDIGGLQRYFNENIGE
jgi:hypothetical protein